MEKQTKSRWKDFVISAIIILSLALLAIYLFEQVNMQQRKPDSPALRIENILVETSLRHAFFDQHHGDVKQCSNICLNIVI